MIPTERMERSSTAVFANEKDFSFAGNLTNRRQKHTEMPRRDSWGQPARHREEQFVIVAAVKSEHKRGAAAST